MNILKHTEVPPTWLIDAIDGAREAHDQWRTAKGAEAPLMAAQREAIAAGIGKGKWHGVPGNAIMIPNIGVTTQVFEASRQRIADTLAALEAGNRNTSRARARFDDVMRTGQMQATVKRLAAAIAVEKHAEASAAWAVVVAAVADCDSAYYYAGNPGTSWQLNGYTSGAQAHQATDQAVREISLRLTSFDVAAVTAATEEV